MKLEAKCNFHNRFDIEVRDKDTGELKQKGMAENIILNRAYTRVCNFSSYFTYIHFGKGTGTLSPSRTTLFSSLGYKSATVDETIREYPISRVTKRIRLEPEEYVGQTITEVGISEATNAINTHALIKDAEGNPLSIVKTALDVVIIYATVYVEFQDSGGFAFSKFPESGLIPYFMTNASVSNTLRLGADSGEIDRNGIGWQESTATLTRTADVAARKAIWSTRLGVDSNNWDIRELELYNICRVDLENSPAWAPFRLEGVAIGVGDGETTVFDLGRYGTSDIVVKVDGNIVSNYAITNNAADYRAFYPLQKINTNPDPDVVRQLNSNCCRNIQYTEAPYFDAILHVDPDKTEGAQIEASIDGGRQSLGNFIPMSLMVQGSYDGEDYEAIGSVTSPKSNTTITGSVPINASYPYLRIYDTGSSSWDRRGKINWIRWIPADPAPKIVFDIAPIEGVEITADYTVPYIPKTSDYVLDVTFELTFGEGV